MGFNPNTGQYEPDIPSNGAPVWGGPNGGIPSAPLPPTPVAGPAQLSGTPEPSAAGLAGIYSRPNPYRGQADAMTARGFQNNGTRQDFLQPVMAFAAGRAQLNERNADETKANDAKAYIARMDAFEQTKANKELTAQKEADFKKNGAPLIATAYREAFKSGGQEAASAAGAKTANDYGNKAGIGGMPFVNSMAMFKDGSAVFQGYEYDAANKKLSDVPTNFRLDVNGQAFKAKGKDWVPVDNFLNADDAARMKNADASQQRASNGAGGVGGLKGKSNSYYIQQNGVNKFVGNFSSPQEAATHGATAVFSGRKNYNEQTMMNEDVVEPFSLGNESAAPPRAKGNIRNTIAPADRILYDKLVTPGASADPRFNEAITRFKTLYPNVKI